MKLTTSSIIAVTIVALAGVAAFIVWRPAIERFLGPDAFKLTYQFLLVTVVGGAVSAIYKEFQRQRDEQTKQTERSAAAREAKRTLQRQFLTDSVAAYNAAKKTRRLLRAKAIERPSQVHREPYDEQMQALMDAQLAFEALAERVRASPTLFPGLEPDLDAIEKYLGGILKEYAACLSQFTGSPPTLVLTSAPDLAEFTDSYRPGSPFDVRFKQPFDRVTKTLQRLITDEVV
jgi:hypothetical protein